MTFLLHIFSTIFIRFILQVQYFSKKQKYGFDIYSNTILRKLNQSVKQVNDTTLQQDYLDNQPLYEENKNNAIQFSPHGTYIERTYTPILPEQPTNYLFLEYLISQVNKVKDIVHEALLTNYQKALHKYLSEIKKEKYKIYLPPNKLENKDIMTFHALASKIGIVQSFHLLPIQRFSFLVHKGSESITVKSTMKKTKLFNTTLYYTNGPNQKVFNDIANCAAIFHKIPFWVMEYTKTDKKENIIAMNEKPFTDLMMEHLSLGIMTTNISIQQLNKMTGNTFPQLQAVPNNTPVKILPISFSFWDRKKDICYQIATPNQSFQKFAEYYGLYHHFTNNEEVETTIEIPPMILRSFCQALEADPRTNRLSNKQHYMLSSDLIRAVILYNESLKSYGKPLQNLEHAYILNFHIEARFELNRRPRRLLFASSLLSEELIEKQDSDYGILRNNLLLEKIIPFC